MLLNFLVNFYLLIPVWLIKLICFFNKDIKREYIFDPQSKLLIYLFPKLELQNVKNDEIKNLRSAIEKIGTNKLQHVIWDIDSCYLSMPKDNIVKAMQHILDSVRNQTRKCHNSKVTSLCVS